MRRLFPPAGMVGVIHEFIQGFQPDVEPDISFPGLVAAAWPGDVAGAELLIQETRRRRRNGGGLSLVKAKEGMCESLRKVGILEMFGAGNVFQSKGEAITAIFEQLDRERCRHCDKRIFSEYAAVEYVGLPHEFAR